MEPEQPTVEQRLLEMEKKMDAVVKFIENKFNVGLREDSCWCWKHEIDFHCSNCRNTKEVFEFKEPEYRW